MEPRTLGKYDILDLLGAGGMGTVYRARDPVLERIVAVKLLHADQGRQPATEGGTRFLNEARAVARLNHPSIVAVYDFSAADPAGAFFAMEYIDGWTIEDYVELHCDDRLQSVFNLVGQLLAGVGYAHAQGVVHRDIKPSNLLVTRDGRLKITDFGIAKLDSLKHTQTGIMIGTPVYMAPERYAEGECDLRCDLYSVGVVLFELLTGRRPFNGSFTEVAYKTCHVMPSAVSTVAPSLPRSLDPVLARALAKDPAARYQTASEFAVALAAAGAISRSPPTEPMTRPALSQGESSPLPAAGGWSAAELAEIEAHLAPILGPMARIVVKRAAAMTDDRKRLCAELASQLRTDAERRRFLGAIGDTGRRNAAAAAATAADGAITAATLERTARVLMRYIGPIATLLVHKTAAVSQSEFELHARLAERINDARDRARFIADLKRGGTN